MASGPPAPGAMTAQAESTHAAMAVTMVVVAIRAVATGTIGFADQTLQGQLRGAEAIG